MKFNEKITILRIKKGLSQLDVANATSVTRQAVQKWERGQSQPNIESLKILGSLFNVSLDYLLNDDLGISVDDPNPNEEKTNKNTEPKIVSAPDKNIDDKKEELTKKSKKKNKKILAIFLSILGITAAIVGTASFIVYAQNQNEYGTTYQKDDFEIITQVVNDGDLVLIQITPKFEMHEVVLTNELYVGTSMLLPYYEDKQSYPVWKENVTKDFSYTSEQVGKKIGNVYVRITKALKQNKYRY